MPTSLRGVCLCIGLETFIIDGGGVHVRVKNRAPPSKGSENGRGWGGGLGGGGTRNLYNNILPQRSQYYYYCCCKIIYGTRPADHRPAGTSCSGVGYLRQGGWAPIYIVVCIYRYVGVCTLSDLTFI